MSGDAAPPVLEALMPVIRADLARHDPITVVYARHAAALDATYQQFCKMISSFDGIPSPLPTLTPVTQAPVRSRPGKAEAAERDEAEIEALVDLLLARAAE